MACLAAERGYPSIVGSRMRIHNSILSLPRGIYLGKDIARTSCKMFGILQDLGMRVMAWDEEAFIYYSVGHWLRRRACECTVSRLSGFFTWGAAQLEELRNEALFASVPLAATGNPRTDMLRPELRPFYDEEVSGLRARFGRMILINTNFGRLNHFLADRRLTPTAPGKLAYRNLKPTDAGLEVWMLRARILEHFQELIPELARAFPDHTILVRPHPAEVTEYWMEVANGAKNVQVCRENSVVPWLLASDVAIHNGCTTGVEAYLLDRPVVAFRPVQDPPRELMLPNLLSVSTATIDETIDAIRGFLSGQPRPPLDEEAQGELEARIAGRHGQFVSDRILDVIDRNSDAQQPRTSIGQRFRGYGKGGIRSVAKNVKALLPFHKGAAKNNTHRFPPIELREVDGKLDRLRRCLGRFDKVEVRELEHCVFEVRPA